MPGPSDADFEGRDPDGRASVSFPILETPRLWLRPLELADAPSIQRIFPHWDIVRYMSAVVPWPYPDDGALTFCRDIALPAMARAEQWHWTLRLKGSPDEMIGLVSLMGGQNGNRGFWIGSPWQRQGLMSEASEAATGYWFETLGRAVLRVPKAVGNIASRRISERSGMRVIRTEVRPMVSGPQLCEIWEITREEWRRRSR
jgi:[ribosomal protein S5]-alanine N-acetyltransferase